MFSNLIFFGMQGSGKGTQGKLFAQKYDYQVFETGKELRKIAQEDSPLGKKVKEITEEGKLVPNEVVMEIVENFVAHIPSEEKVIFDGLPRKEEQRVSFEELLARFDRKGTGVLIKITEEEAIKRLTSRKVCEKCKAIFGAGYEDAVCDQCGGKLISRADDNLESIKVRLNEYQKQTVPVIEKYREEERLIEINGIQGAEEVAKELEEKLGVAESE